MPTRPEMVATDGGSHISERLPETLGKRDPLGKLRWVHKIRGRLAKEQAVYRDHLGMLNVHVKSRTTNLTRFSRVEGDQRGHHQQKEGICRRGQVSSPGVATYTFWFLNTRNFE